MVGDRLTSEMRSKSGLMSVSNCVSCPLLARECKSLAFHAVTVNWCFCVMGAVLARCCGKM